MCFSQFFFRRRPNMVADIFTQSPPSPTIKKLPTALVKQNINHGAIQKVYHLHNGIFHSINLCHIFSILLYRLPCVVH